MPRKSQCYFSISLLCLDTRVMPNIFLMLAEILVPVARSCILGEKQFLYLIPPSPYLQLDCLFFTINNLLFF